MATIEAPARQNTLLISEGPGWSEATYQGLDKLGWRVWRLTPTDLARGEVTNRPPDVAIVAIEESIPTLVHAVQALNSELPSVPIVVLTDNMGAAEQALFAGASAVLPAMARTTLVHAQLRAILRTQIARQTEEPSGVYWVRALKVDTLRCEVSANNRRLDLTPTEYRILSVLVRYAGRALGADFLLQQSSGMAVDEASAREIVKVHIARLRKKLLEATAEDDYIINVRNVGYLLERRRRQG